MTIFDYLMNVKEEKGAGYLPLIDPEKAEDKNFENILENLKDEGIDAILVGGSTFNNIDLSSIIKRIKEKTQKPVIIFPGGHYQVSQEADAIFFLSLLSGRNPEFLIGEHAKAAPLIKSYSLEVIPVAYLLIESGNYTSVEFVSNTKPIPREKKNLIKSHALAGEYLGMKMCYMDTGSGAKYSVPENVIKSVKDYISIPLIVGGGIKTPDEANEKVRAGADFVVTGSIIEKNPHLLNEFSDAIHNP